MRKRLVDSQLRISLTCCAVVGLFAFAALPANAQYAVSTIQQDTGLSDDCFLLHIASGLS